DPSEQADSDGDRVGDVQDAFPSDPNETTDTDGDGIGNNSDTDDDNDGVMDSEDADATDPNVPVVTRPDLLDSGDDSSNADGDGGMTDDGGSSSGGDDATSDGDPASGTVGDSGDDVPSELPENPLAGPVGEAIPGLDATTMAQFTLGQSIFERVFTADDGLTSSAVVSGCAGCHMTPVVGGSGERQPAILVTVNGNLQTTRNIPALFGAGLLERVPDSVILGLQDQLDADGDGISGRVNIASGQVGRFGRKAQAVSLESITRGMLENQLGLTSDPLDEQTGMRFHREPPPSWRWMDDVFHYLDSMISHQAHAQARLPEPGGDSDDGDDIADPEIMDDELAALLVYQQSLAAPARSPLTDEIRAGEALFDSIGCTACHLPSLPLEDGTTIYPYTDLLLHDMGRSSSDFLSIGAATQQEFRTTPLWGVSLAETFLHDGSVDTLNEAILAHDGEALDSRESYQTLSASEQASVVAFLESL
ncbi:MAG: di-heme oxidoredictase family protein, partial [Phycisphaerae bacterium]